MGKTAPKGYLICDGATYNVSDYPELANHFKEQFGSKNYFGGDGTTTFKVPDLRGEFLRGAGTNSHTDQGNGATVGVHQDGTEHPSVYVYGNEIGVICKNAPSSAAMNAYVRKSDVSPSGVGYYHWNNASWTSDEGNIAQYTSRPTNTSVTYIIKANAPEQSGNEETPEETHEDGYVIKWDEAVAPNSQYINQVDAPYRTDTRMGYKQIRYQKPDETWAVANPCIPGRIVIKKDSYVYFDMYDAVAVNDNMGLSEMSVYNAATDERIMWLMGQKNQGYILNRLCIQPISDTTLSCREDSYNSTEVRYIWRINAASY